MAHAIVQRRAPGDAIVVWAAIAGLIAVLSLALQPRYRQVAGAFAPDTSDRVGTGLELSGTSRTRLNFAGWELETFATAWFLAVLGIIGIVRSASVPDEAGVAFRFYLWVAGTVGLGWLLWIAWDVGRDRAPTLPVRYWFAAVGVFVVFAFAASHPPGAWRQLRWRRDTRIALRSRLLWTVPVAFLLLGVSRPVAIERNRPPMGAEFVDWFKQQVRLPIPAELSGAGLTVLRFIDYQCRGCRSAEDYYRPIFDEFAARGGAELRLVTLDFPLDAECNPYVAVQTHAVACEAAAMARLVRQDGFQASPPEQWLWSIPQDTSSQAVFKESEQWPATRELKDRYSGLLQTIRKDVELARSMGIDSTPTYVVNGVKLPFVPAVNLRAVLAYELDRIKALAPAAR